MGERTPHPKRLSVETARDLQSGKIEVPDSDRLRAISPYDPHIHDPEIEMAKTKAERFAIIAHLIAQLTNEVVKGEGDDAEFIGLTQSEGGYSTDVHDRLMNDLFDYQHSDIVNLAKEKVLTDPNNQPVIQRLRSIARKINNTSENDSYADTKPEDARIVSPGGELIMNTVEFIVLLEYHMRHIKPQLSQEQKRDIAISNLSILEDLAAKNINHFDKIFRDRFEDEETGEEEEYFQSIFRSNMTDSELIKLPEGYKLYLKNLPPRPKTGLAGATLGCPANYHLDEGDTALRRQAIAVVNEAYKRGIL